MLYSICQQIWKTQQWPQDWKKSVFISIPKKGNAKECTNYLTIALIHMLVRLFSKSFKLGFSSTWTRTSRRTSWFRKYSETRDQTANIHWIIEKARDFQKNIYFCFIDYAKAFDWRWEYQNTISDSWEICMQVRKQQLELDMEQQTGSK